MRLTAGISLIGFCRYADAGGMRLAAAANAQIVAPLVGMMHINAPKAEKL